MTIDDSAIHQQLGRIEGKLDAVGQSLSRNHGRLDEMEKEIRQLERVQIKHGVIATAGATLVATVLAVLVQTFIGTST